jgi:LuxR family maltose regulon positive regulatory protein
MQRLSSVPAPSVYVVHAPAGYGKSTLIGQFAEADPRPVAWLTLDEQDADPVKCMCDLVFALSEIDDDAVDLLQRLTAGPAAVVPTALPWLTRLLGERWQDALIVLDDVHHATTGPSADVLGALVGAVPEGATLVLAGRARPSLPIARLVADGHLATIDARELRMTVGEGSMMLKQRGVAIDEQEAEVLVRRTEGWPAALYLVSHALKDGGHESGATAPQEAELIDYFRDEVLRTVDSVDVRFLLDSSILEELNPGECDAILDRGDSAERLRSLAEVDLFVVPVEARHSTYRMHGLFREALHERLVGVEPVRAGELHRRAAEHFTQQRNIEAAVRHAIAAGDIDAAAELVWAATPEYEGNGRSEALRRWLGWFSADQINEHPSLALTAGWIGIDGGDGASAEHWTTVALNAPAEVVLATGETMGASAKLLDAALGNRGVVAMREAAMSADQGFPNAHPLKAVAKYLIGAAAYAMDDLDTARTYLHDAQARAAASLASLYHLALGQLAIIAMNEGDWEQAESLMARAAVARRGALDDYVIESQRFAVEARIGAHRGEQIAAREAATRAKRALAAHRHFAPWLAAQSRVTLGAACVLLEWPAEARKMIAEARKLMAGDPDAVRLHRRLESIAAEVSHGSGSISGGEALSTAELRTLQYFQTHLTQREIAERLHLTRNTVHTHAVAIYRKLGVASRSEAVQAGRQHGLLDD